MSIAAGTNIVSKASKSSCAAGERRLCLLLGHGEAGEPEPFVGDLLPCVGEGFLDLGATGPVGKSRVDGQVERGGNRTAETLRRCRAPA